MPEETQISEGRTSTVDGLIDLLRLPLSIVQLLCSYYSDATVNPVYAMAKRVDQNELHSVFQLMAADARVEAHELWLDGPPPPAVLDTHFPNVPMISMLYDGRLVGEFAAIDADPKSDDAATTPHRIHTSASAKEDTISRPISPPPPPGWQGAQTAYRKPPSTTVENKPVPSSSTDSTPRDAMADQLATVAKNLTAANSRPPPPASTKTYNAPSHLDSFQPNDAGKYPFEWCAQDLSRSTTHNARKHVHTCTSRDIRRKYSQAFFDLWKGQSCPMTHCSKLLARIATTPEDMLKHFRSHESQQCYVAKANGQPCSFQFATGADRAFHLEEKHGILISRGEASDSVQDCTLCASFQVGAGAIREHQSDHLDETVAAMATDPRCLGFEGSHGRLNICPFEVTNDTMPRHNRAVCRETSDALTDHIIASHILYFDPSGTHACPFKETCPAVRLKPALLCDHLIGHHDLRLAGGRGRQKNYIGGDYSKLQMSANTKKKFKDNGFTPPVIRDDSDRGKPRI